MFVFNLCLRYLSRHCSLVHVMSIISRDPDNPRRGPYLGPYGQNIDKITVATPRVLWQGSDIITHICVNIYHLTHRSWEIHPLDL